MEINNLTKNIEEISRNKELIVFDLDGTLAESKMSIDQEMSLLIGELLNKYKVAVIGGGKYSKFTSQLLSQLSVSKELLEKLFIFPTNSTSFYRYENEEWKQVYIHSLSDEQKKNICSAFEKAFSELGYVQPEKIYGEVIEDRGTQITFSALGQEAPLELKEKWKNENYDLKLKIVQTVQKYLPDLEVKAAGYTSIDVTQKGIDKEYGLKKIRENLGISFNNMLFFGDSLFPGGNDEAVIKTGIPYLGVKSVGETKKIIQHLLST